MKRALKALTFALIIVVIALYFEKRNSSLLFSEENKTILTNPDSVNASRTIGFLNNTAASANPRTEAYYEKETNSVPVPPELAERVVELITSKDRQSDQRSACIYTPGFAITFLHQGQSIDVFFCFECDGIVMKKTGSPEIQDLGLMLHAHGELLGIFKKLFPSDPAVQKL